MFEPTAKSLSTTVKPAVQSGKLTSARPNNPVVRYFNDTPAKITTDEFMETLMVDMVEDTMSDQGVRVEYH